MQPIESYYKELGLLIGKKRIEKGISQDKLASMLNVDRTTINRWEKGKSKPKPEDIKRVCKLLKIDYDRYTLLASERATQSKRDNIQNYRIKDIIRIPLYDDMPVDNLFSDKGLDKFINVSTYLLDKNAKYFALTMRFKTLNFNVGDVLLFEHTNTYTDNDVLCVALKSGLYIIPPHLVEPTNAKVIGKLKRAMIMY